MLLIQLAGGEQILGSHSSRFDSPFLLLEFKLLCLSFLNFLYTFRSRRLAIGAVGLGSIGGIA